MSFSKYIMYNYSMRSINLFSYTRIPSSYATEYLNMLSARDHKINVRTHEYETIRTLVDELLANHVPIELMEGFFFSFSIRQISKEFDLLKIDPERYVLNIELKSEPVEEKDILKQLRQNRYYLSHIAGEIRSFTFISSTRECYILKDDQCRKCGISEIISCLGDFDDFIREGIERIFEPKQFLISPLNTPEQFLRGQYFLTQQQQEIEESILSQIETGEKRGKVFGIEGSAGTGKTLLLYDIVRKTAGEKSPCCIIHGGSFSEGHRYLKDHWECVDILPAGELGEGGPECLEGYHCLFIDEADYLDIITVGRIMEYARSQGVILICAFDPDRQMPREEKRTDISSFLRQTEGYREYALSEKIRTSAEITSFYRSMLNLHEGIRGYMDYSDIDVIYANDEKEANALIRLYEEQLRYKYIPDAGSGEEKAVDHDGENRQTEEQGFDNVLILMDDRFSYDEEGRIRGPVYPNPELLFYKLMYQDVSRSRSRLCVLVEGNYELFLRISSIKYRMLERYRYGSETAETHLSGKRLNRLAKAVKDSLDGLDEEDAACVSDSVDIIVNEFFRDSLNRKILRNSVRFLKRIMEGNLSVSSFQNAGSDFIDYVNDHYL